MEVLDGLPYRVFSRSSLQGLDEFSSGIFVARDWSRVGGAVYARKTYQRSSDFQETTFMDLKHTPQ
jgi:hypothetical protein